MKNTEVAAVKESLKDLIDEAEACVLMRRSRQKTIDGVISDMIIGDEASSDQGIEKTKEKLEGFVGFVWDQLTAARDLGEYEGVKPPHG